VRSKTLIALTVAAALLLGCGSRKADKAGGVTASAVLRIAAYKDDYYAKLFGDEVSRLSKGRLRVRYIPGHAAPPSTADAELRVARTIVDGRYDLGVVPARTWDELGVRSLEPLQAPFLIGGQSVFTAVLASPVATRMLDGLRAQHVVGLGLIPGQLQHPLGYERPLARLADFRGMRLHVPLSRVNDAVVTALGAVPVHVGLTRVGPLVIRHALDGEEMPFYAPSHTWITANLDLYADASTVVANAASYGRLSADQRRLLQQAAAGAAATMRGYWAHDNDARLAVKYCNSGHVVTAGDADRAELERAVAPVYAQLEQDPAIKATIAAIRDIGRRTAPDPAPVIPAGCSRAATTTPIRGRERDPSFLDGTYRWRITRAGALKRGADPSDPVIEMVATMTLRGGGWAFELGSHDGGTFKVVGNRISFTDARRGTTDTFTFRRRANGTLDLEPVLPMETGERTVMSSAPWVRVGPPVRKVP
jgi:TRAP-type C4-dicarboxylate transport system substrate-binding protein